jgi:hypothetical protein
MSTQERQTQRGQLGFKTHRSIFICSPLFSRQDLPNFSGAGNHHLLDFFALWWLPDPVASGARGREFESPCSDQSNQ